MCGDVTGLDMAVLAVVLQQPAAASLLTELVLKIQHAGSEAIVGRSRFSLFALVARIDLWQCVS